MYTGFSNGFDSRTLLQKENTIRQDGVFFLEQHFCYAKVVACGRVIEREWGNPSKVPPSHSPFLAMCGSADNKTCGQSQKSEGHTSVCPSLFL